MMPVVMVASEVLAAGVRASAAVMLAAPMVVTAAELFAAALMVAAAFQGERGPAGPCSEQREKQCYGHRTHTA